MKKPFYLLLTLSLLFSCREQTENLFDKSADQRIAEAKQALKDDLVSAEHGWRLRYQPENESGSFWVILHFHENNKLLIESDLGVNDGEYFSDELTYRIDSSLGLELIFETYSMFSYLFEIDQATFLAEYEFDYVNKTPEGSLVFRSKSDPVGSKSILLFEKATADDTNLLGKTIASNLNTISQDIGGLIYTSPVYRMVYNDKNLVLHLTIDELRRVLSISTASQKTNPDNTQSLDFSSGFFLQGDSLVLQNRFTSNIFSNGISFKGILLRDLSLTTIELCEPTDVHTYDGITSQGDEVVLEAGLKDPSGAAFTNFDFLIGPPDYLWNNGEWAGNQLTTDIAGAEQIQLYYNYPLGNTRLYAIGFYIVNPTGDPTFALRQFTPQLDENRIIFNFTGPIQFLGNPNTSASVAKMNEYISALTDGGQTYAIYAGGDAFEFHNACTGWSAVFIGIE